MVNGCIVLIIGLPASGKTTFTTKLVNHINTNHVDLKPLYLNFDKVIPLESQMVLVNQLDSSWKENRRHFVLSCQEFLQLIMNPSECHSGPKPIDNNDTKFLRQIINQTHTEDIDQFDRFCFIVEDNFYYKSMREPFFRLSKQFGLGLCLITIDTPVGSCLRRNRLRSECVGEKVINRMADRFERPLKDEFGVHVGHSIQLMEINCDDDDDLADARYDEAVTIIRKACDKPIESELRDEGQQESREASRKVTADNLVHKFDKILRTTVNGMMMDVSSSPSPSITVNIGKELSIIRKRLLKRFADNQLDPGLVEALIKQETPNQRLIRMALDLIESELEERKDRGKH